MAFVAGKSLNELVKTEGPLNPPRAARLLKAVAEADDVFTGKALGVLNMREGKVARLKECLRARAWPESLIAEATFYSDSINDLPLLSVVANPVAVDADVKLAQEAGKRGWPTLRLRRNGNF